MDKITHIALLPPDKFSKRLKDAGLKETEELIATECTLYTPTVDGLRRLVQTVGEQTRSDKITVEVGDHDVTIPLVPGKEIQVTRDGIPDQRARGSAGSPSPSAHTDREEPAESVYSRLERAGARAAIGSGAIPKHANFITGFSPANWEEETWGEKNSVFKPRQTSTEKKDKYGKLVQEDSSDSSSTCYSEDEMLPKRKKVNYKRSKSLSRERRSSSGQREHENLGGRTFLTCPGLVLDSQDPQWSALTEVQQKVVRLAVGPTSDEILDMPGTSFKAKIDMLAEQLDCMQKSLCYLLLDGHKPAKQEPTVNDVRKMRETTYREPESNRDKNKSKKEKAQQRDGSAKIVARESFEKSRGRETHRQVVKYEEESSNSQSEYDYLTSDTEGDCGGEEKVLPLKQGVDLSLTAALARQKREKRKSDRNEEDVSLKPRRGPPRQAKGDRVSAIQLLQNMRFQGAKDSMQKARMIAALGKTLNASTALIEQMIRHHTGISLKLQIIESHYDHVIGKNEKAEIRDELEVVKTVGLWAYLSEKADKGWTEEEVLAQLKQLAPELPGCREITRWGAETDWSEISKFAVRYDRDTVRIREERSGRSRSRPLEGVRIKPITDFKPNQSRSSNDDRVKPVRREPSKNRAYQKPKHQPRQEQRNKSEQKNGYIDSETWAKMTDEQRKAQRERRRGREARKPGRATAVRTNKSARASHQ
ncbi:uncharacterized protein LOC120478221 [Pimephales promelas]|uniref:uncharacterized protein LOC120478221 n=1 Tax=Pimephales promelas TaxID=90988 RepID=UPI001955C65E|nr:uncharacterized protein LOC120478221 [Pimephales promelas]XP_039525954.1 uncharacterized protein LOC120478221 [Pimephales promelas]